MKLRQSSKRAIVYHLLPPFVANLLRAYFRRRRQTHYVLIYNEFQNIVRLYDPETPVVIFPPSLDWDTQLFQRPQHLAMALAQKDALVFYLLPPKTKSTVFFQRLEERLYLCYFPAEALASVENPLIYLLTWNRSYASAFNAPRIIYDYVDEIEVFAEFNDKLKKEHEALLRSAELVLATARRLYEQSIPMRPDALLCPNGVDYGFFERYRLENNLQPPSDLVPILARGKPIIGYYGALAVWFDYPLFIEVAKRRPDLSFVLIGPDYDGTLPPDILELPNVDWLGVKPYNLIPIYLRFFDVATIPFKTNAVTHAVSPLKLFEYMAGGKPVLVTPMEESLSYPGVLVAAGPDEYILGLDKALKLREDPSYLLVIDQVARQNTWQARANQILDALHSAEGRTHELQHQSSSR